MKYKIILQHIFAASLLTIFSCSKETGFVDQVALKDPAGAKIYIDRFHPSILKDFKKESDHSVKLMSSSIPNLVTSKLGDKVGAIRINGRDTWVNDRHAGYTFKGDADEFTMIPSWLGKLDVFHLGSLIKGNTIADLSFTPLSERGGNYISKPIEASVSFASKRVVGNFMPATMAAPEFFGKLMRDNGLTNPVSHGFAYEIKQFNYFNEVKSAFGSNVDIKKIFFNSSSSSNEYGDKITKDYGIMVSFTQKNFTVDMSLPETGELYSDLDLSALGGVWPAYINSMAYGSKGIILIESNAEIESFKKTVEKAFSVMGGLIDGTKQLSQQELNVLNQSEMNMLFIGTDSKFLVKSLTSFGELIGFVKKGNTFGPNNPGVPISFNLRSLNKHTTIKNYFEIKVPIDHFYVYMVGTTQKAVRTRTAPRRIKVTSRPTIPVERFYIYADPEGQNKIIAPKNFVLYVDYKYETKSFLSWGSNSISNRPFANLKQGNPIDIPLSDLIGKAEVPRGWKIFLRPNSKYTQISNGNLSRSVVRPDGSSSRGNSRSHP